VRRQRFVDVAAKMALEASDAASEDERVFAARVLATLMPIGGVDFMAKHVREFIRLVQGLPPSRRTWGLSKALAPLVSNDDALRRVVAELDDTSRAAAGQRGSR
jgi:hypothetical protein